MLTEEGITTRLDSLITKGVQERDWVLTYPNPGAKEAHTMKKVGVKALYVGDAHSAPDHGYAFGFGAVVDKSDRLELSLIRTLSDQRPYIRARF
jgi:hypothetical protein